MKKSLLDARLEKGFSQEMLAESINMTQTQISLLENGKSLPRPTTKRRLELALNAELKFERR